MKKICLRQEEKVKSSFFGFNNVVTRCFSCKLKEVREFFLLTQEFICISMCNTFSLKWGSQKSHLWVFITCQRNVSRHWRSYRMKSCLLQTTNWGEERRELHCKTLPIHISYSVLIIILLAYKKIQNTPSIIQHEWRWCATLNSKAIIDFLSFLKTHFWHLEWPFVKISSSFYHVQVQ